MNRKKKQKTYLNSYLIPEKFRYNYVAFTANIEPQRVV